MKTSLIPLLVLLSFFQSQAANHNTTHFSIKGEQVDSTVLVELGDTLERNYARITGSLSLNMTNKITVHVYKDLTTYHNAINLSNGQDWQVGNAVDSSKIHMVSPANPGPAHTKASLMRVIVHEFVHNCVAAIVDGKYPPVWINEGAAVYYARQTLTKAMAQSIYAKNGDKIPSISSLNSNFNGNDGYQWAETILQYVMRTFNADSLVKFLQNPYYYGVFDAKDQSEFNDDWQNFVIKEYLTLPKVKFQVDVSKQPAGIKNVSIYGAFNNWCKTCDVLSDANSDKVYEITLEVPENEDFEFKYVVHFSSGSNAENFSSVASCLTKNQGGYINRVINVESDTTMPVVCFNSCDVCDVEPDLLDVTLKVDLNKYSGVYTSVMLFGNFNRWCNSCDEMTDVDSDGVYEKTIQVSKDYDLEWKYFLIGPDSAERFDPTSDCVEKHSGYYNRYKKISQDFESPAYCWNSCEVCKNETEKVSVTFKVDMSKYSQSFQKVYLSADYNNWCGSCDELLDLDKDKVYEITKEFKKGEYIEWKYTVDDWSASEDLNPGSSCTKTFGMYTNRYLTITESQVLDPVCWSSCTTCGDLGIETMQRGFQLYPNPNAGAFRVKVDITTPFTFSIISLDGRTILKEQIIQNQERELTVNGLMSGSYVVCIESNNLIWRKNVIVRE